jgi:tetratricopeptide (TPR) repeat protein
MGMNDKADAAFRHALDVQAKVVADFPDVPEHSIVLGAGYCNFGNLLLQRSRPQDALPSFAQAITTLDAVLARQPRLVMARQFLSNSYWGQARAFDDLGQHGKAARAWEQALEFDDGTEAKRFRTRLALSRLRAGLGQDLAWPLVWGWPRF